MGEEAENSETVIDGDRDEALACEAFSTEDSDRATAFDVCAAMKEYEHGTLFVWIGSRGPDVEREAVFGDIAVRQELVGPGLSFLNDALDATWAEVIGDAKALPFRGRLWSVPAFVADGWCGVGNAFENGDGFVFCWNAFDETALRSNRLIERGCQGLA